MIIPYNDLFASFEELANDLIDVVNATTITAYLNRPTLSDGDLNLSQEPSSMNYMGGLVPIDAIDTYAGSDGNNKVQRTDNAVFKVRRYWAPKEMASKLTELKVEKLEDVCKIVSYISDRQILLNAVFLNVDGYKCVMIKPPLPHGLGGPKYDTSYWKIING